MIFDYSDERPAKARAGRIVSGTTGRLIALATVLAIVVGMIFVATGFAFGWLLVGICAVPAMLLSWRDNEARELAASKQPHAIHDVLESKLMSTLPRQPSPQDIARAVSQSNEGLFYAVRFGITPNFLQQISSSEQSDTEAIWREAHDLFERLGHASLGAGIVIYSLVKQFPEHEAVLAHNHMSLEDIIKGIEWQQHLALLIKRHQQKTRTGGIARDWSFGYTPLLSKFGQNISRQISLGGSLTVDLESHQDALVRLIDTFATKGRQNAAIVGATGVGKTTVVHAFAEKLLDASSSLPSHLKFRQIVMLSAASLISAAPGRGQLEQLIMNIFGEAYAAKNIIICLDDAQLFFEEGVGSVDLSNVLLPILESGKLRVILTLDESRYLKISQRNAQPCKRLESNFYSTSYKRRNNDRDAGPTPANRISAQSIVHLSVIG